MKISDYYNSAAKLNLKTYQKDSAFNRILIQKPIHRFWLTRLLKNEKNKSHSSIGDLGCGDGEKLALLLRQFPEVNKVFITDISTEILQDCLNHPSLVTLRQGIVERQADQLITDPFGDRAIAVFP